MFRYFTNNFFGKWPNELNTIVNTTSKNAILLWPFTTQQPIQNFFFVFVLFVYFYLFSSFLYSMFAYVIHPNLNIAIWFFVIHFCVCSNACFVCNLTFDAIYVLFFVLDYTLGNTFVFFRLLYLFVLPLGHGQFVLFLLFLSLFIYLFIYLLSFKCQFSFVAWLLLTVCQCLLLILRLKWNNVKIIFIVWFHALYLQHFDFFSIIWFCFVFVCLSFDSWLSNLLVSFAFFDSFCLHFRTWNFLLFVYFNFENFISIIMWLT